MYNCSSNYLKVQYCTRRIKKKRKTDSKHSGKYKANTGKPFLQSKDTISSLIQKYIKNFLLHQLAQYITVY